MSIIDGKEVSKLIKNNLKIEVAKLENKPKLVVILVGDDPASKVYVNSKGKACELVGINHDTILMDKESTEEEVLAVIEKANADKEVDGILLQLPLPKHLDSQKIINCINPSKDVDGLNVYNQGQLFMGSKNLVPCTPKGVIKLLEHYNVSLEGKRAIVIGRSLLVGKPLAMLLLEKNATVTIAHSHTKNLKDICLKMDIVISAVGKPHFVTADMVKDKAVVIDVGINRTNEGLTGDVDFEEVSKKASLITPVPGGVGPMTIACLLENVVECYKNQMVK